MVRDVAAPVRVDDLATEAADFCPIEQKMGLGRPPADGDRVRVLEQKEMVGDTAEEPALEREGVVVRDPPQPPDVERPLSRGRRGQRTSASQSRVSMISFTRCMKAAA